MRSTVSAGADRAPTPSTTPSAARSAAVDTTARRQRRRRPDMAGDPNGNERSELPVNGQPFTGRCSGMTLLAVDRGGTRAAKPPEPGQDRAVLTAWARAVERRLTPTGRCFGSVHAVVHDPDDGTSVGTSDGAGGGPARRTAVLVHGMYGSATTWSPVLV